MSEKPVSDERAVRAVTPSAAPDLPPQLIRSDTLSVVRKVDPSTGYVYSYYVDGAGEKVPIGESRSLQKATAGFIPAPT